MGDNFWGVKIRHSSWLSSKIDENRLQFIHLWFFNLSYSGWFTTPHIQVDLPGKIKLWAPWDPNVKIMSFFLESIYNYNLQYSHNLP